MHVLQIKVTYHAIVDTQLLRGNLIMVVTNSALFKALKLDVFSHNTVACCICGYLFVKGQESAIIPFSNEEWCTPLLCRAVIVGRIM